MSRLGRAWARLLPPERREWAEALWAEAQEAPSGWRRLAWRAGGVAMIARETRLARRARVPLLFAAAAGVAAWAAWPDSSVSLSHGGVNDGDIIITLALLAVLPLLIGRSLGPPGDRVARWLRAAGYTAFLVIMPAKAIAELFSGAVPRGGIDLHSYDVITESSPLPGSASGGPDWGGEIVILLITACYLVAITALTARRAKVAPATLIIGASAGLVLGLVVFAADPVGGRNILDPGLRETRTYLQMLLTVDLLATAGAATIAGVIAARRCRDADAVRIGQGVAAGLVTAGAGALVAVVLDTGATALMIKSALVRGWILHGQHLTASAVYGRELVASRGGTGDAVLCVILPFIGLLMGLVGTGSANMADSIAEARHRQPQGS